jgi:Mg2+ and Co2+ transporter CorA
MPETHNPWGFWIVCVVLGAIAVGSWLFLRWRRWA